MLPGKCDTSWLPLSKFRQTPVGHVPLFNPTFKLIQGGEFLVLLIKLVNFVKYQKTAEKTADRSASPAQRRNNFDPPFHLLKVYTDWEAKQRCIERAV